MPTKTDPMPWYREPWPWLIMTVPSIAVIGGAITMALAFSGKDGLVADDYYRQGLAINRVIARESAARALGIRGVARFGDGDVEATLEASRPLPDRLHLHAAHVTRSGLDRSVVLARGIDGVYRAPIEPLPTGRWRVAIETEQWRVVSFADTRGGAGARAAFDTKSP